MFIEKYDLMIPADGWLAVYVNEELSRQAGEPILFTTRIAAWAGGFDIDGDYSVVPLAPDDLEVSVLTSIADLRNLIEIVHEKDCDLEDEALLNAAREFLAKQAAAVS